VTDWYYGTDTPDYRTVGDIMKRPALIIAQYLVLALFTDSTSPVPTSRRRRLPLGRAFGALAIMRGMVDLGRPVRRGTLR
jgi:hypothetical protein